MFGYGTRSVDIGATQPGMTATRRGTTKGYTSANALISLACSTRHSRHFFWGN